MSVQYFILCPTCKNETHACQVWTDGALSERCRICGYFRRTVTGVAPRDELTEDRREHTENLEECSERDEFLKLCETWDRHDRGEGGNIFEESVSAEGDRSETVDKKESEVIPT